MTGAQRGDGRCKSPARSGEGGFRAPVVKAEYAPAGPPVLVAIEGPSGEMQVVPRYFCRPESVMDLGRFFMR